MPRRSFSQRWRRSLARGWQQWRNSGHDGPIVALAFAGVDAAVTASKDGTVRLWDMWTNACVHTIDAHEEEIMCMALTHDGVPVNGGHGSDRLGHGDGNAVAPGSSAEASFSSSCDGQGVLLFTGGGDKVARCWDLTAALTAKRSKWDTGGGNFPQQPKFECEPHVLSVRAVQSRGHQLFTASDDRTLRMYDLRDVRGEGKQLKYRVRFAGHDSPVVAMALHGGMLVSGAGDCKVLLWNTESAAQAAGSLNPADDGYRAHEAKAKYVLKAHDLVLTCLLVDDDFLVSGAMDGRVLQWAVPNMDAPSSELTIDEPLAAAGVHHVAPVRGHSALATMTARSSKLAKAHDVSITALALNPYGHQTVLDLHGNGKPAEANDMRLVISGSADHTLRLWRFQNGSARLINTFGGPLDTENDGHRHWITCIVATPSLIFSGSEDGTVMSWSQSTYNAVHVFTGHSQGVSQMILGPRGFPRRLYSASKNGSVRVWSLRTGWAKDSLESSSASWVQLVNSGTKTVSELAQLLSYPLDLRVNWPGSKLMKLGLSAVGWASVLTDPLEWLPGLLEIFGVKVTEALRDAEGKELVDAEQMARFTMSLIVVVLLFVLIGLNRRYVIFWRMQHPSGETLRGLRWFVAQAIWYFCFLASSVLFLPILDAMVTVLLDPELGRRAEPASGKLTPQQRVTALAGTAWWGNDLGDVALYSVFAGTCVVLVAYVLLVLRLNLVDNDVDLLDVNSLLSGKHDLSLRATEPEQLFSRRSVSFQGCFFGLATVYSLIGTLFEEDHPQLCAASWAALCVAMVWYTILHPPFHRQLLNRLFVGALIGIFLTNVTALLVWTYDLGDGLDCEEYGNLGYSRVSSVCRLVESVPAEILLLMILAVSVSTSVFAGFAIYSFLRPRVAAVQRQFLRRTNRSMAELVDEHEAMLLRRSERSKSTFSKTGGDDDSSELIGDNNTEPEEEFWRKKWQLTRGEWRQMLSLAACRFVRAKETAVGRILNNTRVFNASLLGIVQQGGIDILLNVLRERPSEKLKPLHRRAISSLGNLAISVSDELIEFHAYTIPKGATWEEVGKHADPSAKEGVLEEVIETNPDLADLYARGNRPPRGKSVVLRRGIAWIVRHKKGLPVIFSHVRRTDDLQAQVWAFNTLLNLVSTPDMRLAVVNAGGMRILVNFIRTGAEQIIPHVRRLFPERKFPFYDETVPADSDDDKEPRTAGGVTPGKLPWKPLPQGQYHWQSVGFACRILSKLALTNPLDRKLKRRIIYENCVPAVIALAGFPQPRSPAASAQFASELGLAPQLVARYAFWSGKALGVVTNLSDHVIGEERTVLSREMARLGALEVMVQHMRDDGLRYTADGLEAMVLCEDLCSTLVDNFGLVERICDLLEGDQASEHVTSLLWTLGNILEHRSADEWDIDRGAVLAAVQGADSLARQRHDSTAAEDGADSGASHIVLDDRVIVGGRWRAQVRYVGRVEHAAGEMFGVEMERGSELPGSENDGSVGGVRYFTSQKSTGRFVRPQDVEKYSVHSAADRVVHLLGHRAPTHRRKLRDGVRQQGLAVISDDEEDEASQMHPPASDTHSTLQRSRTHDGSAAAVPAPQAGAPPRSVESWTPGQPAVQPPTSSALVTPQRRSRRVRGIQAAGSGLTQRRRKRRGPSPSAEAAAAGITPSRRRTSLRRQHSA